MMGIGTEKWICCARTVEVNSENGGTSEAAAEYFQFESATILKYEAIREGSPDIRPYLDGALITAGMRVVHGWSVDH